MKFSEIIDQASALIQQNGRITYRSLKREFDLDDEALEDLKEELLYSRPQVVDDGGRGLIWSGAEGQALDATRLDSGLQPLSAKPVSYTPQHLAERILAEQAAMESRGSTDGERKTITALFADLKGSTALIEGLDPEDARALIDPALQLMMDAVHRYDGYVAQALGDGIFALFGAPIAHEDHPQRALYAALMMQEQMRRYSEELREKGLAPLSMRVGVNTGEVVVRSIRKDDLHADYVPVGHSTNIAARMEQLANPGAILVTEQTYKLTDGYFEFAALGQTKVKGIEEPVPIYEVVGAGPLRTKLQVALRRGLTRFVGRRSELEQLHQALDQAKAGQGQIVGVLGEPGLGKSRLFYEFKQTAQRGCLVLEAFAVSHGKATPYWPIIELLKDYFQLEPQDEEQARKEKVTRTVLTLDHRLEATLPYLFALLGLEDQRSSLQHMDAQIRRQRTFEALKTLFLRASLEQPLILVFEDLQWLDTETQGFLDTLSDSVASAPVLLLVNCRPEYRHGWGQKTYYTQLRLAPLGEAEAAELLTFLLGHDASLTPLKPLILQRTEGTPFFLEEVVQTLIEDEALTGDQGHYRLETPVTELHISPTVQGVLAARIDRLPPEEKALLQYLSVIGRQFPFSLVTQVVPQTETGLQRVLSSLQAKEFLYERPAFPEVAYLFKHALTQEVTYGTVLQAERKALHERTGQAIEALYRASLEDHYSELAYHYSRSNNAEKAVEYLQLAGQQAVQRAANVEAVTYFTTALDVLQTLPDTSERKQHELGLLLAVGVPLTATTGWSAEVERVYVRARELCEQVEDSAELFPALFGLCFVYLVRAELKTARELGEHLLRLAQSSQDPALLLEAHYMIGMALYSRGDLVLARPHLEHGSALYDSQQHHALAFRYGSFDPGVACLCETTIVLWCLGYPEQALRRSHEALGLAQEVSHPVSLVYALTYAAFLYQLRREERAVQDKAEAAIAPATEHGSPVWLAMGAMLRGWALAAQGQGAAGLSQLREGMVTYRATGTELWRPHFLALLAEAYGKDEQGEAGLTTVAEALDAVNQTEERYYEAELYLLKGELLLNAERRMMNDERKTHEAEASFLKAVEIARRQETKSWELRAATSLARLWQQQGKTTEAYNLLAPVYDWFTEGFDTVDLKDAKSLLDELSEGV